MSGWIEVKVEEFGGFLVYKKENSKHSEIGNRSNGQKMHLIPYFHCKSASISSDFHYHI